MQSVKRDEIEAPYNMGARDLKCDPFGLDRCPTDYHCAINQHNPVEGTCQRDAICVPFARFHCAAGYHCVSDPNDPSRGVCRKLKCDPFAPDRCPTDYHCAINQHNPVEGICQKDATCVPFARFHCADGYHCMSDRNDPSRGICRKDGINFMNVRTCIPFAPGQCPTGHHCKFEYHWNKLIQGLCQKDVEMTQSTATTTVSTTIGVNSPTTTPSFTATTTTITVPASTAVATQTAKTTVWTTKETTLLTTVTATIMPPSAPIATSPFDAKSTHCELMPTGTPKCTKDQTCVKDPNTKQDKKKDKTHAMCVVLDGPKCGGFTRAMCGGLLGSDIELSCVQNPKNVCGDANLNAGDCEGICVKRNGKPFWSAH